MIYLVMFRDNAVFAQHCVAMMIDGERRYRVG